MAHIKKTRLAKELQKLDSDPPAGIICYPKDESDITKLESFITGPPDSPYENGRFKLDIQIPQNYPLDPPQIRFITKIYHPNIDQDGRICLDVLKKGQKGSWTPSLNINSILLSLVQLLGNPNPDDPLETEIAKEYQLDYPRFLKKAKENVLKYASGKSDDDDNDKTDDDDKEVENKDEMETEEFEPPKKKVSLSRKSKLPALSKEELQERSKKMKLIAEKFKKPSPTKKKKEEEQPTRIGEIWNEASSKNKTNWLIEADNIKRKQVLGVDADSATREAIMKDLDEDEEMEIISKKKKRQTKDDDEMEEITTVASKFKLPDDDDINMVKKGNGIKKGNSKTMMIFGIEDIGDKRTATPKKKLTDDSISDVIPTSNNNNTKNEQQQPTTSKYKLSINNDDRVEKTLGLKKGSRKGKSRARTSTIGYEQTTLPTSHYFSDKPKTLTNTDNKKEEEEACSQDIIISLSSSDEDEVVMMNNKRVKEDSNTNEKKRPRVEEGEEEGEEVVVKPKDENALGNKKRQRFIKVDPATSISMTPKSPKVHPNSRALKHQDVAQPENALPTIIDVENLPTSKPYFFNKPLKNLIIISENGEEEEEEEEPIPRKKLVLSLSKNKKKKV